MSEYRLSSEIVARSVADNWQAAKLEWQLHDIEFSEEPETCLCGHYPIIELCHLSNYKNRKFTTVGNCCVKKFLGIRSDLVFDGVKRIAKDTSAAMNAALVEFAFEKGWINDWEHKFATNTSRKRALTGKQLLTRMSINEKVLRMLKRIASH